MLRDGVFISLKAVAADCSWPSLSGWGESKLMRNSFSGTAWVFTLEEHAWVRGRIDGENTIRWATACTCTG